MSARKRGASRRGAPGGKVKLDEPRRAEADENRVRLDFTPSEKVAVADYFEAEERAKAEAREKAGKKDPRENCPRVDKGRTRDALAARVGVSGRTLEKAKAVVEAAKAERFVSDVLKRLGQINLPKRELTPEPPPGRPQSKGKPKYTYPTPWNELQQQRRIATAAVRGIVARRPVDYRLEMRKLILETTTPIPKLPGVLNSYAWDPGLVVEVLEEILYAASELNETVHFSALTKKIFFGAVIERLSHAQLAKRHGVTRQVIDRHIARVERFLKKYSLVEAKKGRSGGALPQRVGGPDDASSRD